MYVIRPCHTLVHQLTSYLWPCVGVKLNAYKLKSGKRSLRYTLSVAIKNCKSEHVNHYHQIRCRCNHEPTQHTLKALQYPYLGPILQDTLELSVPRILVLHCHALQLSLTPCSGPHLKLPAVQDS